jgi:hypothetical protein
MTASYHEGIGPSAEFSEKQVPCQQSGLVVRAFWRDTEPLAVAIECVAADAELPGSQRHVAVALAQAAQQSLSLVGLRLRELLDLTALL